jgi:hypothetical protein
MRVGSIVRNEVFHSQLHDSTLDNGTAMSSFSDDNDTAKLCLNSSSDSDTGKLCIVSLREY